MSRDLDRFVRAQDSPAGPTTSYDQALAELRRGRKTGHWMWWVFPQLAGLGTSPTSQAYAVADLDEARAYLAHPVLGPRLREACEAVLAVGGSAREVLGGVDAMKLRSSATLFLRADPDEPVLTAVLDQLYDGVPDDCTDALLG